VAKQQTAVAEPDQAVIDQPASALPSKKAKSRRKEKPKRQPRYHVILWDDDDHSYDYVSRMMQALFGATIERGYEVAKEVDTVGRAICLTTTLEHAELKRDQIHAFGKDALIARCQGSMSASIEAES
jgi:ATP-dependent Clp protease adaptor protein ClpS